MHVLAPAAIWTYVYAYSGAGGDSTALWAYLMHVSVLAIICTYVYECLRRRRRYGVTFLRIAAPAVMWIHVYRNASVAGGGAGANVAVAQVSRILRLHGGWRTVVAKASRRPRRAHVCAKVLRFSRKTRCLRMRRSRSRAVGGIRGGLRPLHPRSSGRNEHYFTHLATQGRGGFNRYRAFRRVWVVNKKFCVIWRKWMKICRHPAICSDIYIQSGSCTGKTWELHVCKLESYWVVWSHLGMLHVKP